MRLVSHRDGSCCSGDSARRFIPAALDLQIDLWRNAVGAIVMSVGEREAGAGARCMRTTALCVSDDRRSHDQGTGNHMSPGEYTFPGPRIYLPAVFLDGNVSPEV